MNLSQNIRSWIGAAVWLGAGMAALAGPVAQTIPFSNNFDYVMGTPVQSLTNMGWDASDPSVQIQTNVVCVDTSSVVLPQNTALTNWVTGAMTNVWTDFYVQMEPRNDTNDADAVSNAVLKLYIDQTGFLKVYDKQNGWLSLSNTVRGAPVTAYTNGQWGRVTLFQNYAAHQCAVFLDNVLVKELLPFASNMNACAHFRVEGGPTASSYFDNFSMTRVPPPDLADGAEIDAYGYLAFTNTVGVGQAFTDIQSAINAARARYIINMTAGTYNENVTVDRALGGITGGAFTINGTLAIASGLSITSAVGFTVSNLSILAGARLVVSNSTVTANGMTLSGTFTLDQNWGNQGASALLPYSDNFDPYPAGTPMNSLGFRGWGASDSSVAVEQGTYVSASNGVNIGFYETLSNRVNATANQVWTDFRVIPTYDANDDTTAVRSTSAFMAFVTTNGYLSLYNRTQAAWEVCTNDVWGHSVSNRQAGQWSRLSVLCDYNTKQCAVFLDGVLLRQEFPFINQNLTSYSALSLVNQETNAVYLDNVYIGTNYPSSLTNDVNGNNIPDAQELPITVILTQGSVFKIR